MAEMTEFDTKYDGFLPTYQALAEEVKFILKGVIADNQIKIHDVECRVKEKQSVLKKSVEKDFEDPLSDLNDIIGARVICLFRDDMKKIDALVKDNFNVISIDDKINGTSEAFGYMSVRYICQIKSEYAGYRYEKLKNFKFEIQARTL